jgi:hypothetical protein
MIYARISGAVFPDHLCAPSSLAYVPVIKDHCQRCRSFIAAFKVQPVSYGVAGMCIFPQHKDSAYNNSLLALISFVFPAANTGCIGIDHNLLPRASCALLRRMLDELSADNK